MAHPLAITMGDPSGCGPIITASAWTALRARDDASFFVISDPKLYTDRVPVAEIQSPEQASMVFPDALPVLPLRDGLGAVPVAGQPDRANAAATVSSIAQATQFALDGEIGGVVTNPISKAELYKTGFTYPGHTEYIAALCADATGAPVTPIMMLIGGGLRVALATIHVPFAEVPSKLSTEGLVEIGTIVSNSLKRDFGLAQPKIAFSGLNPHAGEDGTIGREEVDIINPAAALLRDEGVSISDARPGDTVFHEALSGQFDAVIAMTHDQGLIPVKTLDLWGGVNTTLGLPIIRTSPDHGTAYEAAASGSARDDSLIAAIELAKSMANSRHRADAEPS